MGRMEGAEVTEMYKYVSAKGVLEIAREQVRKIHRYSNLLLGNGQHATFVQERLKALVNELYLLRNRLHRDRCRGVR